jgi:redox-sensitive bicupin YhaK (pirin superfamily)
MKHMKFGIERMLKTTLMVTCAFTAFGLGVVYERAESQMQPRMQVDTLLSLKTDAIPKPTLVEVKHDQWEPGSATGRHSHPGPAVFIMLQGELEETLQNGEVRTLREGQVNWKPAQREHNVKNVSGRMARAIVVHLDPARLQ